ncbi:hypothetical protein NDU88_002299 [Pleurodeles waltl]|uniref:Uncharacterized protein n=1 Tax=Pleurodeles waltl TaxID=8319 RepID=A0AAV7T1N3_PLEWA|nr:hypothetical protein NDU88_002299 [Pleurodeles waltl]
MLTFEMRTFADFETREVLRACASPHACAAVANPRNAHKRSAAPQPPTGSTGATAPLRHPTPLRKATGRHL